MIFTQDNPQRSAKGRVEPELLTGYPPTKAILDPSCRCSEFYFCESCMRRETKSELWRLRREEVQCPQRLLA